ncbi:UDP-glycosyltransferase 91C1-like [Typha angustifolia]|uniref:UDP-glycosyltransferase 91C1-like n=1 Tax=Typha angustifolia TaxID=59011 RepID=UPI003C30B857
MEEEKSDRLHIVVIPWVGFTHVSPFFELSKRMAQLGHHISFISTKPNIERLASAHSSATPSPSPSIQLVPLPGEDLDSLQEPFVDFLRNSSPPPDWILFEFFANWATSIAPRLGIRCALVSPYGAAANGFIWPTMLLNSKPEIGAVTAPLDWAPFTTTVAFRTHEARQILDLIFGTDASGLMGNYRVRLAVTQCDVVALRSCGELEPEWLQLLPQLYHKPVVPLGHFPPTDSGSSLTEDWEEAFAWLDEQQLGSVVYVAFGSELDLSQDQVDQLAHGLEQANLPFLWAFRSSKGEKPNTLPHGFEGRIRGGGFGFVRTGWAPQVRILGHPSVGGFLTHCGWNSLVEALQFGLGLVMLPLAYDQGLNARLMADKGIGLEIPRNDEDGYFSGADVAKTLRSVMVEPRGKELRDRAKELKSVLGSKELHDKYVREFLEFLKENKNS